MPKLGVFVGVVGGIAALVAVLAIGIFAPGGSPAKAQSSAIDTSSATTITVDASDGAIAWGRLRWLLAGLSISSVVLVAARQAVLAGSPKRVARPVGNAGREPLASQPQATYRPEPAVWIPDGSQVSIGD